MSLHCLAHRIDFETHEMWEDHLTSEHDGRTEGRYRCVPCQAVLPTLIAWSAHVIEEHGCECVFRSAGMNPPTSELPVDLNDPEQRALVTQGIIEIIQRRYSGRGGSYQFSDAVKAAIRADLAIDADPYWMMSDDYGVRPQARLTPAGQQYAREMGLLALCVDHVDNGGACHSEVLVGGDTRCPSCASSLSAFGPPPHVEGVPELCGMCHVTIVRKTDPTYVIPRASGRYGWQQPRYRGR